MTQSRFPWHEEGGDIASADLLRECGQKLTNRALWEKFQERFRRTIFTYVLRAVRQRNIPSESDLVSDLAQDVYMRLVQNDGRMLLSYKGNTEFSVKAFLASVSMSVVSDYYRSKFAEKRQFGQLISIESGRPREAFPGEAADFDMSAVLSWIDVERLVESDSDHRFAARNVLIFKLHYIDGFTAEEISGFSGFNLTVSGIETILTRLKARLKSRTGR